MNNTEELEEFVLPSEASHLLGVSAERVRQLVDRGVLPAKRGPLGHRLISRAAVVRLARERKRERVGTRR